MDGYGFAWACVALLALGGCTLGRSHCPASAVLWGSWARLNWFSASMLFSTSLGLSLHFLLFCEGREPCVGRKKQPTPLDICHVRLSTTHILWLTLDKWSPVVKSVHGHSAFWQLGDTLSWSSSLGKKKKGLQEGLFHGRKHNPTVKRAVLGNLLIQWLVASCDLGGGKTEGGPQLGLWPSKNFPSLTQSH